MHQEVITSKAKQIFDRLSHFPDFYLAGGTGLALQLGHRISVDFDFFWRKNIPNDLLSRVRRVYKDFEIKVVVNHPEHWDENRWPIDAGLIQKAGLNIVRLAEFAWSKLEPEDGTYNFSWLDEVMDILKIKRLQ